MEKKFESINVDSSVRKCLERACIISDIFTDEKVRSAYVIMAMFGENSATLNKFFREDGLIIYPEDVLSYIYYNKEVYSHIFGEEAAKAFFNKNNEKVVDNSLQKEDENKNSVNEEKQDKNFEKQNADELNSAILDAFSKILVLEADLDKEFNLEVIYSNNLEEVLEDASIRCLSNKQNYLDIDNLLYSILKNENTSAYKMLDFIIKDYNYDVSSVIDYLEQNGNIYSYSENSVIIPKSLENCCTILNSKFDKGQKSDILNREKEIFKAWTVFSKKTKRNLALIGDPGVGKTAIVETLVQDIVNKTCPKEFYDYTVIEFDVGSAVAGTKYRGEFEEKINKLKKFLQNTPKVIIFVDEMHQMLGAGSCEGGGVDLSGALKPILSRDDVVFIGSYY